MLGFLITVGIIVWVWRVITAPMRAAASLKRIEQHLANKR